MNGVDRTHLVLQPFQANRVHPERRRGRSNSRPFDLDEASPSVESEPRVEAGPERTLSSGGDEGVGEHVNIVV
jgi:hypothetical protein